MSYWSRRVASVLTLAMVAACADAPDEMNGTMEPDASQQFESMPEPASIGWSLDDRWSQVAQTAVPGFAGHYFGENGQSIVLLVDQSRRPEAREFVNNERERAGFPRTQAIDFRQADYSFFELKQQHDRLLAGLSDGDVRFTSLDVDEVRNRLVVGVEASGSADAIRAVARELEVPEDMVVVEVTPPVQTTADLDDRLRPGRGGPKIALSQGNCTLGFNVNLGDDSYFVTNSHCSEDVFDGSGDGTEYGQPDAGSGDRIGEEYDDPALWTGSKLGHTCTHPSGCRLSDANLVLYDDSVSSNQKYNVGVLWRTESPGYGSAGSKTIDSSDPMWYIYDPHPTAYQNVGHWVNKIGQKTGWTRGQITHTCVTYGHLDGGDQLCQFRTELYTEDGDSGAAVFMDNNDEVSSGSDFTTLYGIVWGRIGNDGIYSPIGGATTDLGIQSTAEFCYWGNPLGC